MQRDDDGMAKPVHSRSSGSRVEIWQGGRNLASATFPYFYEPYEDDRAFTDDLNWHNVQLRLTTDRDLVPGEATLRFTTAEVNQPAIGDAVPEGTIRDDYEVKNVRLWAVDETEQDSRIWDSFEIKNIRITATGVPTTRVNMT